MKIAGIKKVSAIKLIALTFPVMGRIDPVECAKRARYKPPAMWVRNVRYTQKITFPL